MRLGKYLTGLTKSELEELKDKCGFTDTEEIIFKMVCNEYGCIEISEKICISTATVNRKIRNIKDKIERCEEMRKVPVWEKMNLSVEEAAEYSNIGINKLYEMISNPACPFVLYIGKKRLIKRKQFEKYIEDSIEI